MAETVPDEKPSREELHKKLEFLLDVGGSPMADRIATFFAHLEANPRGTPKSFTPGPRGRRKMK